MQDSGAIEATEVPVTADWRRAVFEEHQSVLVAYVQQVVGDLETARDVVQDAFLRLCHEDDRNIRDHPLPWLYTVCRRRALDVLRRQRRMTAVDGAQLEAMASLEPDPAVVAEGRDRADEAIGLLPRLAPNQREVVVLKFLNAMSYKEISQITGLSVGNVGFLLHTALRQLRRHLESAGRLPHSTPRRTP
jgi:RNA polymerase sigma-70 factor (ECF subfamily)